MPAKTEKQRRLMAMALFNPEKVSSKNKGVLKMNKESLQEFVSAKKSKHKNSIRSMVDGDVSVAKKVAKRRKGK